VGGGAAVCATAGRPVVITAMNPNKKHDNVRSRLIE
jgi:hypothetical protein